MAKFARSGSSKRMPSSRRPAFPPPFQSSLRTLVEVRYIANTAVAFNGAGSVITYKNLMDIANNAATATSAYRMFNTIKLKSVEMWAPASSSGQPVSCSLDWSSSVTSIGGASRRISDTTMGTERPAHIYCRPPKDSVQAMWQDRTSTVDAFSVACPIGTVIHLTYIGVVPETVVDASVVVTAPAGATTGGNYRRSMDGVPVATAVYTVVDYAQD